MIRVSVFRQPRQQQQQQGRSLYGHRRAWLRGGPHHRPLETRGQAVDLMESGGGGGRERSQTTDADG